MKDYGIYLVTGRRQYRRHDPGTQFEAALDPAAEQRAIDRGDIRLLERVTPDLAPGSYVISDDWPPGVRQQEATTGGAARRLSH